LLAAVAGSAGGFGEGVGGGFGGVLFDAFEPLGSALVLLSCWLLAIVKRRKSMIDENDRLVSGAKLLEERCECWQRFECVPTRRTLKRDTTMWSSSGKGEHQRRTDRSNCTLSTQRYQSRVLLNGEKSQTRRSRMNCGDRSSSGGKQGILILTS
jgi:hypothetical protein